MSNTKKKIISKGQGLFARLRAIRESDTETVVTYCFEEKKTFNDYDGDPTNKPKSVEEKGREWKMQQPINKDIFFENNGRPKALEDVAEIFKSTADDLGAKYFVV